MTSATLVFGLVIGAAGGFILGATLHASSLWYASHALDRAKEEWYAIQREREELLKQTLEVGKQLEELHVKTAELVELRKGQVE